MVSYYGLEPACACSKWSITIYNYSRRNDFEHSFLRAMTHSKIIVSHGVINLCSFSFIFFPTRDKISDHRCSGDHVQVIIMFSMSWTYTCNTILSNSNGRESRGGPICIVWETCVFPKNFKTPSKILLSPLLTPHSSLFVILNYYFTPSKELNVAFTCTKK
jgi:hypothetical protein